MSRMRCINLAGVLRRRLFREESKPTLRGKLAILGYSLRTNYPQCSKRSSIVQTFLEDMVCRICATTSLCKDELERSACPTHHDLKQELLDFLRRRKFRTYLGGPPGWSCDKVEQSRLPIDYREFRHLEFVGVRLDVAGRPKKPWARFALRHELQHEIQRWRIRFTCQQLKQYPCMVHEMESEADMEALHLLNEEHLAKIWDPYCWKSFLRMRSWYAGASPKQQRLSHYGVAFLLFLLCCCIPYGTEGVFAVIFFVVAAAILTIVFIRSVY